MKITCDACGTTLKSNAKLEASLDKLLPGQKLRLKCSHCGSAIALGRDDLMKRPAGRVKPPGPPDTSWLKEGLFDDDEVVSDIPQAMVVMAPGDSRDKVIPALAGLGYRVDSTDSGAQALDDMQFFNYSCVVLHSADGNLDGDPLHGYMSSLPMSRRRYIFYALIGKQFNTFYNMQALANSANLVIDEADLPYFSVILRKAIPEYEALFGPYMDELKIQGK